MAKQKKLSKSQTRRIKANQSKRLAKAKNNEHLTDEPQVDDSLLGAQCFGRVITRYGQHADVEIEDQSFIRCNIRRNVDSPGLW